MELNRAMAEEHERKNLYYSALTANLLYMSVGCVTGWPSAAIASLRKGGLTSSQETWMVSLSMLGSVLGPTVYTLCIDRIGRKYTLLLTNLIYFTGWIILGLADGNLYALYAGRFIGGIGNGVTINVTPVYITETSDVKMRQALASLAILNVTFGQLIEYAVGPWVSYELIVTSSAIPNLVLFLAWMRLPESPYHLVRHGKMKEAASALVWLRGSKNNVDEELHQIEGFVKESKLKSGRKLDLILQKGPRKALILGSLMLFIQPFCGVDVINSYLDPILSETSLPISHQVATVVIGVINCLFAVCEPFVVHRFGSKWTMIVCSFLCTLFMMLFGIYKYFDERHYDLVSVSFVPLTCIILFEIFFGLGYGMLPWTISAELFPPSLKGFANNVVTTINCIMAFVSITLYGDLSPVIGASTCFIVSAVFFICADILVAFVLPNTRGLSLEEIQEVLEGKK